MHELSFNTMNTCSIHQRMIRANGECETKLDAKGTLSHGMRTSMTLDKWVKLGNG